MPEWDENLGTLYNAIAYQVISVILIYSPIFCPLYGSIEVLVLCVVQYVYGKWGQKGRLSPSTNSSLNE